MDAIAEQIQKLDFRKQKAIEFLGRLNAELTVVNTQIRRSKEDIALCNEQIANLMRTRTVVKG